MSIEGQNIREITSGMFMLSLAFCKESGEGDDVGVDLLRLRDAVLVGGHGGRLLACRRVIKIGRASIVVGWKNC